MATSLRKSSISSFVPASISFKANSYYNLPRPSSQSSDSNDVGSHQISYYCPENDGIQATASSGEYCATENSKSDLPSENSPVESNSRPDRLLLENSGHLEANSAESPSGASRNSSCVARSNSFACKNKEASAKTNSKSQTLDRQVSSSCVRRRSKWTSWLKSKPNDVSNEDPDNGDQAESTRATEFGNGEASGAEDELKPRVSDCFLEAEVDINLSDKELSPRVLSGISWTFQDNLVPLKKSAEMDDGAHQTTSKMVDSAVETATESDQSSSCCSSPTETSHQSFDIYSNVVDMNLTYGESSVLDNSKDLISQSFCSVESGSTSCFPPRDTSCNDSTTVADDVVFENPQQVTEVINHTTVETKTTEDNCEKPCGSDSFVNAEFFSSVANESNSLTPPAVDSHTADIPGGSHTVDIPGGSHIADIPGGSHTADIPGGSRIADIPGGPHTADIPGGSHTADIPGGSHIADIPGGPHTADIPGGSHTADVPGSNGCIGSDSDDKNESYDDNLSEDSQFYPSFSCRRSYIRGSRTTEIPDTVSTPVQAEGFSNDLYLLASQFPEDHDILPHPSKLESGPESPMIPKVTSYYKLYEEGKQTLHFGDPSDAVGLGDDVGVAEEVVGGLVDGSLVDQGEAPARQDLTDGVCRVAAGVEEERQVVEEVEARICQAQVR